MRAPVRNFGYKTNSYPPRNILFLTFSLLTLTLDLTLSQCPPQCSCVPYTSGQAASCGPGLTSFPLHMPSDVLILTVSALPGQAQNNILSISEMDFAGLNKLKRFTISSSNVQKVPAGTFATLSNLSSLDLKGNRIIHLSKPVFQGLSKLDLLDLTDNVGCFIEFDTFDDLTSLSTIRLAGIGLTQVGDLLSKLTSLKTCDLHRNRLVRLDSSSFAHLSSLGQLDVSFNNLREIQPGMNSVLSGLTSLNLHDNPWRCNCALVWAKKSLPAKFVFPSFVNGGGIVCDKPSKFQFTDLRNVQESDMTCIPARIDSCSSHSLTVRVKEGDPVTVTCTVVGDPFPDVVWSRPDSSRYSYTLQADVTSATTVSIPVAEYSIHDGKWKIDVFNCNGSDTKMIEIDVYTTTSSTTTTTTTTTTKPTPTSTTTTPPPTTMITTKSSTQGSTSASRDTHTTAGTQRNSNPSFTHPRYSPGSQEPMTSPLSSFLTNAPPSISTTPASDSSSSTPSGFSIVLVVAATVGGIVCFTGISVLLLVIYKVKQKTKIASKRKSIHSTGDFKMFARFTKNNMVTHGGS